uniref:Arm DNA-binding domain-containing protein n=1 Tax=Aquimarina longa TaxID=1080221 RepID=UPI000AD2E4C5
MASVKILLYKNKQNSKGKYPIVLRITKDRIPKYKFLEYIDLKDWNEEKTEVRQSHHSYKLLNNLIDNEYVRAKNLILDFEAKDKKFTANQLMTILKGNRDSMTFSKLSKEYLKEKKSSNKRGYSSCVSRVEKFKEFLKGDDIHFENITESLI